MCWGVQLTREWLVQCHPSIRGGTWPPHQGFQLLVVSFVHCLDLKGGLDVPHLEKQMCLLPIRMPYGEWVVRSVPEAFHASPFSSQELGLMLLPYSCHRTLIVTSEMWAG